MTEYCPQCGAPLPENCLFCPSCGASCAQPSQPEPQPAEPVLPAGEPVQADAPAEVSAEDTALPAGDPAPEIAQPDDGGQTPPPPGPGPRYAAQPPRRTPRPAPAAAPDKNEMTTGRYLLCLILFAIPVVGLVMMFIWAFGHDGNVQRRRLARAALLFTALVLVLVILAAVVLAAIGALSYWLFPHRYGNYYQNPYDYFEDYLDGYDDYYDYYYEDPYDYYGGGNGYGGHHLDAVLQ